MTKLKRILEEQDKTLYEIGRAMGLVTAPSSIRNIATGKTLISECDFTTLNFLTRFLKVAPEDLMESFELDGTVENVKYLKNLKNRFSKKLNKIDDQNYFGVYTLNGNPAVVYITEDENENSEISVIFVNEDGTSKTLKADYTIENGYREANFTKTVSEQPLFKETPLFFEPSLFSEDQNKKGIGKNESDSPNHEPSINLEELLKAVDRESANEIDYFEFMEEINPVILKVFRKN